MTAGELFVLCICILIVGFFLGVLFLVSEI